MPHLSGPCRYFFRHSTKVLRLKTLNATFPFPQVFGLRRLRSNPPCSLWLQSVHWTNCFTRRAHITVPPCREPTVTAWRGTTLGRDITYAISLIMPLRFVRRLRNNMAQSLVLCVKSDARCGRRLAAQIPSFKLHIPFISTLRIGFRIRLRFPQLLIIHY